jgi:cold shock CspA family protein
MFSGTVRLVAEAKPFGTIEADGTHDAIFYHQRNSKQFLRVGDRVQFLIIPSRKIEGQYEAVQIQWLESTKPEARP